MNKTRKTGIRVIIMLFLAVFIITGCSHHSSKSTIASENQPLTIMGEWLSFSIENNDPLFKENPFTGTVKVSFKENGTFEWFWYEITGKNVDIKSYSTGTYKTEGKNKLIAHDEKEDEDIICDVVLESNNLTLKLDDGFIFKFNRVL